MDAKWHGHEPIDKNEDRLRINSNEKTIQELKRRRKVQHQRQSEQKINYDAEIEAIKSAKKQAKKTQKALIKQA